MENKILRIVNYEFYIFQVCETPVRTNPNPTNQKQPIQPHKPPLFETQFSNISSNLSSGSATPTSEPGTPTCDEEQIDEQTDPVLAETSIEQMQARLHAEFLQSVSILFSIQVKIVLNSSFF